MNVTEFSIADLVAMENDLEGLPPSLERDAKSNLLKYLLISKVKEYELHYDDLFYNLQLEGSLVWGIRYSIRIMWNSGDVCGVWVYG
ncbi:unnamed protein product, partial [Pylaiella littoralis]